MTTINNPATDFAPCDEWDNGPIDEDTKDTVIKFAAWLNYLLNPELHDGPRRYICADCGDKIDSNKKLTEGELNSYPHGPGDFTHTWAEWELHSVLQGFDASAAFYAIHELSGMRWFPPSTMERVYTELHDGYLCSAEGKQNPERSPLYKREHSYNVFARKLSELLAGIGEEDPRYAEAKTYHDKVLQYAESHENQMWILAETIGRYRGAFLGARNLVLDRMEKMVELFEEKVKPHPTEISWSRLLEVTLPIALNAVFSLVPAVSIPGKMFAGVITGAISELIVGKIDKDEAGKQYEPKGPNDPPHYAEDWLDLVNWFVSEADRISNELFISIVPSPETGVDLSAHMTGQLLDVTTNTGDAYEPPALPSFVPPA